MKRVLICWEPHEGRAFASPSTRWNGELTSLMRKALRKPQSRRREHSKHSYGCPWKLHADSIEINADPDQLIETRSNIRAIWPS